MKEILKAVIKPLGIVVIFIAILCLKTYILYDLLDFQNSYSLNTIKVTVLLGFFVFSAGILFKKTKTQILYSIIISTLLGAILFGNRIFFTYNKTFLSIFQIKSIGYANEIESAVTSFYEIRDIVFFVDLFAYIIYQIFSRTLYIIKINKKKNKNCTEIALKKENVKRPIHYNKLICFLIFTLIFVSTMFSFFNITLDNENVDTITSYGRLSLMKERSIWNYCIQDLKLFVTRDSSFNFVKDDAIKEYFDKKEKEKEELDKDVYANIDNMAEGKDIYIVQLESFQNFVINKKVNGKEVTPNLNKFASENVYFSNFHSQSAVSNTADCEHSSSTSLYPFANYALFQFYDAYKSENIYSIAKEKGYFTSYMHANVGYFWNRENVYKNMGVDKIVTKESYKDFSQIINNWIADNNFFQENVDKIINEFPKDKNKLVYMTTVSSHLPFDLDKDLGDKKSQFVNIDVGEYKGTVYGNYLESINYVDTCFGLLIERLEKEKLLENSLIIVYGDHFGIPKDNVEYREDMLINGKLEQIDYNHTNVPCIIKVKGLEAMEIEEAKSQLDLKPTIAKMLGVKDSYSFGYNLFTKKDEVHFVTGNYINRNLIYIASNNAIKNYVTGETIKLEKKVNEVELLEHEKIKNSIELEKIISETIVKTNYLEKVK